MALTMFWCFVEDHSSSLTRLFTSRNVSNVTNQRIVSVHYFSTIAPYYHHFIFQSIAPLFVSMPLENCHYSKRVVIIQRVTCMATLHFHKRRMRKKNNRKREFSFGEGPDILMQPPLHGMPVWHRSGLRRHKCACSRRR